MVEMQNRRRRRGWGAGIVNCEGWSGTWCGGVEEGGRRKWKKWKMQKGGGK